MNITRNYRVRAVAAALVALVLSFSLLRPAGELSAILIRRQWPQAWFSGLIVWYADFLAVALSIGIAFIVWRKTAMVGRNRTLDVEKSP